jgi:hypothetical protein
MWEFYHAATTEKVAFPMSGERSIDIELVIRILPFGGRKGRFFEGHSKIHQTCFAVASVELLKGWKRNRAEVKSRPVKPG